MRKLLNIDWNRVSTWIVGLIRNTYWKVREPTLLPINGPPGAGKDTAGVEIAKFLKLPIISTGQLFREEIAKNTEFGRRVKSYVESGRLVPDALVMSIVMDYLKRWGYWRGAVLNGFPRTLLQAKMLDRLLESTGRKVWRVLVLAPDEATIIDRLSKRRTCESCGKVYHLVVMPPKKPDVCDACNGKLIQRSDDVAQFIEARLAAYRKESGPIYEHYKAKLITVVPTPTETPKQVLDKVKAALKAEGI
jgi:adenylate kinase